MILLSPLEGRERMNAQTDAPNDRRVEEPRESTAAHQVDQSQPADRDRKHPDMAELSGPSPTCSAFHLGATVARLDGLTQDALVDAELLGDVVQLSHREFTEASIVIGELLQPGGGIDDLTHLLRRECPALRS